VGVISSYRFSYLPRAPLTLKQMRRLDKLQQETECDECQQCIDLRQQIKGLKRRLSSVRYADDHMNREQGVEEREALRSENSGLRAMMGDLQRQVRLLHAFMYVCMYVCNVCMCMYG
jgi:hypothetical protein